MARDINTLLDEIRRREEQLEQFFEEARAEFRYSLEGRRVRFSKEVKALHRRYRVGLLRYIRSANPLSILTAPVIYSMVVPLALLDLAMTVFQHICFRAYGVPRVQRNDYLVIDRHRLGYLNPIEKYNCVYCGYANGLLAYSREIVSRTEQYWCPIRHARRVHDAHSRYPRFFAYGDPQAYRQGIRTIREALRGEREPGPRTTKAPPQKSGGNKQHY